MSIAEGNRQRFDKLAMEYDTQPWTEKMIAQLTDEIRNRLDWIGVDWATNGIESPKEVRLLDYACGTGMVSRALGPHVTTTRGIDISPNMVSIYNDRAAAAGLPRSQIHAVVGDLFATPPSPPLSDPEFANFDIAVVGLGFHHFDDAALAAARLAERLKPGGVLLITDFIAGHGETVPEEYRDAVKVIGFQEGEMRRVFEGAGLVDFAMSVFEEHVFMEMHGATRERTVFAARGRKPAV